MRKSIIHKKNKSIIMTWVISYTAILILPVIMSVFVFTQAIDIIKVNVDQFYEENLKLIQSSVDSKISELKRISHSLAYNSDIKVIIQNNIEYYNEQIYTKIYPIVRNLTQYAYLNGDIDNIYLCMPKQDMVINTSVSLNHKELFQRLVLNENSSYEECMDKLYGARGEQFFNVQVNDIGTGTFEAIAYVCPVAFDGLYNNVEAVCVIVVNKSKFMAGHENVNIINNQGEKFASEDTNNIPLDASLISADSGIFKADKNNMVAYRKSTESDWVFLKTISTKLYENKVRNAQQLLILSVLLSLVLGSYTIFISIRRNYNPIKGILNFINSKSNANREDGNEYNLIYGILSDYYNKNEEISNKLEISYDAFKYDYVLKILKGDIDVNNTINGYFEGFNIEFVSDYFGVILISVDDMGEVYNWENGERKKSEAVISFLIQNVLGELVSQKDISYITTYDGMTVCLVNLNETYFENGTDMMFNISKQLKGVLKKEFNIELTCAISSIQEEVVNIPQAFEESKEAMKYKFAKGTDNIIKFDGIEHENETASYFYPIETERQLINNIKVGNFEKVCSIIDSVIQQNFKEQTLLASQMKLIIYELYGTIVKTVDEIGIDSYKEVLNMVPDIEQLFITETVNDVKEKIFEVLKTICADIKTKNMKDNLAIYTDIAMYVKENYNDCNLCIVSIGEHFSMSPYYLSKLFKQNTGEGLPEYINRIRIEKATKILVQNKYTVAEIAQMVGYTDTYTFTRLFKKITGVSTGKYKEINKNA